MMSLTVTMDGSRDWFHTDRERIPRLWLDVLLAHRRRGRDHAATEDAARRVLAELDQSDPERPVEPVTVHGWVA